MFSIGNGLKGEEITWRTGKEGKWRKNQSTRGACEETEQKNGVPHACGHLA
jgi:hypothetical protein